MWSRRATRWSTSTRSGRSTRPRPRSRPRGERPRRRAGRRGRRHRRVPQPRGPRRRGVARRPVLRRAGQSSGDGRTDLNGHGTHVAGIIAARAGNWLGIAGARARREDPAGPRAGPRVQERSDHQRASGYARRRRRHRWAANNGATVINLSLGSTGEMPTVNIAIAYAVCEGRSGRRGGRQQRAPTPGRIRRRPATGQAIAVAATDRNRQLATYSSWWSAAVRRHRGAGISDHVDVVAGGGRRDGAQYMGASGTSMAAPHVAAEVALIRAVRPDLDVAACGRCSKAPPTTSALRASTRRPASGMVDPAAAVRALVGVPASPDPATARWRGAVRSTPGQSGKIAADGVDRRRSAASATGVPWDASAAALNVTAVEADREGYFTVWPATAPVSAAPRATRHVDRELRARRRPRHRRDHRARRWGPHLRLQLGGRARARRRRRLPRRRRRRPAQPGRAAASGRHPRAVREVGPRVLRVGCREALRRARRPRRSTSR